MKDAYTKLMLQQYTSEDAAFYEKLEQTHPRKRISTLLRIAMVAACLCLLIPATVLAAGSIFSVSKVTVCERPMPVDGLPGIGMDIQYENIGNYELKDFPRHLQKLEEGEIVLHTSQEDVEKYLGLDLIENAVLSADDTHQVAAFDESGKNYQTYCGVWDGQFLFAKVRSVYKRNGIRFNMTAIATVEHPTMDEKEYHNTNITYFDENNREILSEQYVTQGGIPVLIVTVMEDSHLSDNNRALVDYFACFAVNNISYKIELTGWFFDSYDLEKFTSPEEKAIETLTEILDGFVLE